MTKKLIFTTSLAIACAASGLASTAMAGLVPHNATPVSTGACNMLHASNAGLNGMMNDPHVLDIMIPLVEASLKAGCVHP